MKKIILILMMSMFLISLVSAETSFYVQKETNYTVKFSCENNGGMCSASATCNITINYPNSTTLIDNQATTNSNNGYFYYNLTSSQTTPSGEYSSRASCIDGSLNAATNFVYEVNPSGIRPSDQKTTSISRGIYFTLVIAILFFIAFLFSNQKIMVKWTYFSLFFMFFIITLNILFVGLQTEVVNTKIERFFDGFTAISWYIFWFAAGVLIIMWIFTFLQTWLYKKNLQNLKRFGGEMV